MGVAKMLEWITLDTSETGFQYLFANGNLYEGSTKFADKAAEYAAGEYTKDTVASSVVMKKSNGELAFLGGQDMFDKFVPAAAGARTDHWTQHDGTLNSLFLAAVRSYVAGESTKDEAIANFKTTVKDTLGFDTAD